MIQSESPYLGFCDECSRWRAVRRDGVRWFCGSCRTERERVKPFDPTPWWFWAALFLLLVAAGVLGCRTAWGLLVLYFLYLSGAS